ncbi:hypothetical protein GOY17_02610 [Lysobacter soli]|uniref:Uncharacterized protein n=1 Tax=Lysobacter soli TaxID=453783 RepID=A0A3D8VIN1_9GAMM|nr:hypothetical protein [Lysobacter soli]QGW63903.1 hypothetical protein GOY17_02610 [Lysobacter soli]RDY68688.1 hypothetical protein DX912_04080 [Lysobacter soli]
MSIVDEIGRRLGVLASRAAQDRYMVNATSDQYLLPVEAINDAQDVIRALSGSGPISALEGMESKAREAVQKFALAWRSEENQIDAMLELPWDELVLRNQHWHALRGAAQLCLVEIGFDLAQWERDESYVA